MLMETDKQWKAGPALGGWGTLRDWTLGPQVYNALHLTHNIYVNKNIDLF